MVAVPEIVAVGRVTTVIIALPDCVCEHDGAPAEVTLTKAYVEFAVNAGVVRLAVPVPFKAMV